MQRNDKNLMLGELLVRTLVYNALSPCEEKAGGLYKRPQRSVFGLVAHIVFLMNTQQHHWSQSNCR
jgi:hypothetical protein